MKSLSILITFLIVATFLISCSPDHGYGGALNKEQVLELNPDADLFVFEGRVYSTGVDWIEDKQLTKDEKLGQITEGMANRLPLGAEIFSTEELEAILIVEYGGIQKRYLVQLGE